MTLRLGSRGSALAVIQTSIVADLLVKAHPGLNIGRVLIRTSGDQGKREVLGAFVTEVQDALLDGRTDVGIHSLKDMPTGKVDGLTIAAIPVREDSRDIVLSALGAFLDLPSGARVGTGCPRRQAQLASIRPDLNYLPIVGNVDSRIRKLYDGQYDAIVLALAGIKRLKYVDDAGQLLSHYMASSVGGEVEKVLYLDILDSQTVMPAPGQGALALECRASDVRTLEILQKLDDCPSHAAVTAERTVLNALGGGCSTPIAAYGSFNGSRLTLMGLVSSPDGKRVIRASAESELDDPVALGLVVAEALRDQGAEEILGGNGNVGIH